MFAVEHAELPIPVYIGWRCAGRHIHLMSDGAVAWLKMHGDAPPHDHLIFRIGNRLFFAFVDVPNFTIFDDVARQRIQRAADEANAIACLMPMRADPNGPDLIPAAPGWGLVEAVPVGHSILRRLWTTSWSS